jgi:hypothetical protein
MSLTSNTNKDNRITAQVLNTTLLRSANFYEVECFKGLFEPSTNIFAYAKYNDILL